MNPILLLLSISPTFQTVCVGQHWSEYPLAIHVAVQHNTRGTSLTDNNAEQSHCVGGGISHNVSLPLISDHTTSRSLSQLCPQLRHSRKVRRTSGAGESSHPEPKLRISGRERLLSATQQTLTKIRRRSVLSPERTQDKPVTCARSKAHVAILNTPALCLRRNEQPLMQIAANATSAITRSKIRTDVGSNRDHPFQLNKAAPAPKRSVSPRVKDIVLC